MLSLQFGFTDESNDPGSTEYSPLSSGYIAISYQSKDAVVVNSRYEILHLGMNLIDLMSDLTNFFSNRRTKHCSFLSTDRQCYLQFDRRKRAMIYLQTRDIEGVFAETDVAIVFQQALKRFFEGEYTKVSLTSSEAEGLRGIHDGVDEELRQCYRTFLAMKEL